MEYRLKRGDKLVENVYAVVGVNQNEDIKVRLIEASSGERAKSKMRRETGISKDRQVVKLLYKRGSNIPKSKTITT